MARLGGLQRTILSILDDGEADWATIRQALFNDALDEEGDAFEEDAIISLNPTYERSARRALQNLIRRNIVTKSGTRRLYRYSIANHIMRPWHHFTSVSRYIN